MKKLQTQKQISVTSIPIQDNLIVLKETMLPFTELTWERVTVFLGDSSANRFSGFYNNKYRITPLCRQGGQLQINENNVHANTVFPTRNIPLFQMINQQTCDLLQTLT